MSYQHLLFPGRDYFTIVHVESNCEVGYVRPRDAKYRVQNDYGDDVVLVNSIDEAIPALLDYYEEHPPRWECDSPTGYTRLSQFGLLMVEQDQSGWLAYRYRNECYCPLLRDGEPAIFTTSVAAQQAADAHVRDDCEAHAEGFSWDREGW